MNRESSANDRSLVTANPVVLAVDIPRVAASEKDVTDFMFFHIKPVLPLYARKSRQCETLWRSNSSRASTSDSRRVLPRTEHAVGECVKASLFLDP